MEKIFAKKLEKDDWTLTDFHTHRQKLGIILENKVVYQKLNFSENVNPKNCSPKLILFNEKINQEDSRDFSC